jgi:hypothetical protein
LTALVFFGDLVAFFAAAGFLAFGFAAFFSAAGFFAAAGFLAAVFFGVLAFLGDENVPCAKQKQTFHLPDLSLGFFLAVTDIDSSVGEDNLNIF